MLRTSHLAMLALAALALVLVPDLAYAFGGGAGGVNTQFLQQGTARITVLYNTARTIIYVIGAIGLIVLAIFSFFGKWKWNYFFALAGGMFMVAMVDLFINFLGGQGNQVGGTGF
jgi:hypothetical protein